MPALLKKRAASGKRFAWLPKKLSNGTVVWLESYRRYNIYNGERRPADEPKLKDVL